MFLAMLKERFWLQVGRIARFVLVGFYPADILASAEAPSPQAMPSRIQTLRRTTPQEHKRGVSCNLI